MADNTINGVKPKEAETKEERLLLGFISTKAEQIGFGQIVLELTIQNGKVEFVRSKEVNQTFRVGGKI